jgi:hypothetical protein
MVAGKSNYVRGNMGLKVTWQVQGVLYLHIVRGNGNGNNVSKNRQRKSFDDRDGKLT